MPLNLDTPIAELELFGLPLRTINHLEERHGVIYFRDLRRLTRAQFLAGVNAGKTMLAELERAMVRFLDGKPVKTPEQCTGISKAEWEIAMRDIWKTGFLYRINGRRVFIPPKSPLVGQRAPLSGDSPPIPLKALGLTPLPEHWE